MSFVLFKYSFPRCLNIILPSKTSGLPVESLTPSILVTEEMAARPTVQVHPFYFFAHKKDKCQREGMKAAAVVWFHLVYHVHLTLLCAWRPRQDALVEYSITMLIQGLKGRQRMRTEGHFIEAYCEDFFSSPPWIEWCVLFTCKCRQLQKRYN